MGLKLVQCTSSMTEKPLINFMQSPCRYVILPLLPFMRHFLPSFSLLWWSFLYPPTHSSIAIATTTQNLEYSILLIIHSKRTLTKHKNNNNKTKKKERRFPGLTIVHFFVFYNFISKLHSHCYSFKFEHKTQYHTPSTTFLL